jgi:hypothetical protein
VLTRAAAVLLGVLALWAGAARAQDESPEESIASREIFARHAQGVAQVQIQEAGSSAKRSIGSGFAVSPAGLFVTNYHVVSAIVDQPERYQVRIRDSEGVEHPAELVAFDVVQDLALLRSAHDPGHLFALHDSAADPLRKGEHLFSLGNPLDLGMSVVEGTYNGLLEHSRYARIHWSGSLNPGMSGGPALLRDGQVAGVNVATAGDQVSFLVPVRELSALLARAKAANFTPPADPREELRTQLLAQQEGYLAEILAQPVTSVRMGPYSAPTALAPFFNCWGDAPEDEEAYYEERTHACFTEDQVFVSDDHSFAIVELHHLQLSSDQLRGRRFYTLYSQLYEEEYSRRWGRKEDITPFRCRTEFVEHEGLRFKTSFCARQYRRLAGLYDVVFKAAALGKPHDGFATALLLSGVALDPARALSRRVLENIRWAE